jgi:DNA replication protein DnaC
MDLVSARITQLCERLKLGTVAAEWPAIADAASGREASFAEFLERLLAAEAAARDGRSREVLLKLATLPSLKTLEQYD